MKSVSNKKQDTLTVCIAVGLVAGGVLGASAQRQQDRGADRSVNGQQEQPGQQQRQQPGQWPGAQTSAQQPGMRGGTLGQMQPMVRASQLLKKEARGQDGKKLGDVEEIVLSQDRRRVEHIKVSLDDGGSVKLSLDEVSAKDNDYNVLTVLASKQELQQRKTRDRDRARGGREQDGQESRRVSKLIGRGVQGTGGKDVGSIDDLIIDTQSGRIKTAAVKTGGLLGLGTRLASVEWQQVNFTADGDIASINMTRDTLSERAHKQSEYWDRHAFEGQRERGLQQTGMHQRAPGMEQGRDQDAQSGQRERIPGMENRQQMDQQQPGQRTLGVSKPRSESQIQGQDDAWQRRSGTTKDTAKADTTARSVRDRNDAPPTPFVQGNSKADTDTSAQIRKEIKASENMSVSGKNVEVMTRDGRVTLRGSVDSAEEKRLIGEVANRIVRSGNVDNQLEVKSTSATATTSID